jgi:hypothetical protein
MSALDTLRAARVLGIELAVDGNDLLLEFAYDRAMILLYGDQADTNFSPEESEHITLPVEVMRQINALKAGKGRLQ